MSHLPHLIVAAVAALLRRPATPDPLPYPADGPVPVPPDWQAIEPRWDCQRCRSVRAAEILPDGFRCLHCGVETVTTYA